MILEITIGIIFFILVYINIVHWMSYITIKFSKKAIKQREVMSKINKHMLDSYISKMKNKDNDIGYQ